MTGTTIAQAIPVVISPILTRLYTPEDFGVAALYMAIAAIFGSIATARYELAVMLPEEDDDALNIVALGLLIATALSVVLLFVVILFNSAICDLLDNRDISLWLYFIPLSVFFIGLFNVLQYYNNRTKQYKDLAKANVYKSLASVIVRLSVVFIKPGPTGLISGQITAQIVANTKLLLNTVRNKNLRSILSINKMKLLAKRYDDFPKYSTAAVLANTSSYQLTNILISAFYSISTLGFYSLVQRILGMPSALVGRSVGQVFYQQAAEEKRKTGTSIKIFIKTALRMVLIGLPIFFVLFFIVEDLFAFVFSEKWRVAGEYAKILIPLYYVRFFVSPITVTNQIYLKNKLGMIWQIGLLFLFAGILAVGYFLNIEFKQILQLISVVVASYYLLFLFIIYSYLKNEANKLKNILS
jgi:O-antigen/teichoic acid export membrane protein